MGADCWEDSAPDLSCERGGTALFGTGHFRWQDLDSKLGLGDIRRLERKSNMFQDSLYRFGFHDRSTNLHMPSAIETLVQVYLEDPP